jgi:hypothetical protein
VVSYFRVLADENVDGAVRQAILSPRSPLSEDLKRHLFLIVAVSHDRAVRTMTNLGRDDR